MNTFIKGMALALACLVLSVAAQTNIALHKTVTASTVQSGNLAANAVDSNTATRWCASDGTIPQWLMVDLGASYNLTKTEIYWEKNLAYKYKIETSPDNVTWTQRVDRTTNTTSQQTFDDNFTATARYIRVTCTALPSGNWVSIYEFRVYGGSVNVAPQITTQPVSRTVTAGQTAAFSVVASGTPAPTYQWRKNGTNIPGATSASYTTPATVAADNGALFSCVATNSLGSATSSNATLTVNFAPAITIQPSNVTVTVGQSATFSVVASGNPAPTYQWRLNGNNIPGSTLASITIPAATAVDDRSQFSCYISNSVGNVTSNSATLTVNIPPTITTQPVSTTVTEGQSASFSIIATGSGTLTYQWRRNGANIPGATSTSYMLSAPTISDSGAVFSCIVTNLVGSVTSANATLTVQRNPRRSDSLALVALYNSTGGPSWINKTNWLTAQPMDTWFGITVSNNRVTQIIFNSENNLNGTLPSDIGNLTNLTYFNISAQQSLQGQIPKEIGKLINLEYLLCTGNKLTGRIPSEIGNLVMLKSLYLLQNMLTDTIPSSLGNIPYIIDILLYQNQLTGPIPSSFGNLHGLQDLDLYNNRLSGQVPSSLGNLTQLVRILLSNNLLTGSLPSQIGNISNLSFLSINNNLLTNLPNEITNLNKLQSLDIGNNQFCSLSPSVATWANQYNPGWASTQTCSPPQVQVTANPQSGTAPLTVQFAATNTGLSSIDTWAWIFGDGAIASTQNVSHTYSNAGAFTAQLIVQGIGGLDTARVTIQVNPGAPIVHIAASPQSGYAPLNVTFSATNTGGAAATWNWIFGDGSNSALQNPQHTYSSAGTFKAIVSGTNVSGTSRDSLTISVTAAQLPVISSNPVNIRVNEGQPAVFTVVATGTPPLAYQWKKGGVNVGINSSSLSLAAASASDAGSYWVIVSNAFGLDTSTTALLTVLPVGVKFNTDKLSVSGDLRDASGNPVGSVTPDTVDMTIRILNRDTGGVALYTERFLRVNYQGIIVDKGLFAARLGEGTTQDSLKQVISNNPYLWVQIVVEGAAPDTLRPRTPLTASGQAMVAGGAQPLHGSGDPTASTVGAVIGTYYVNDTNGATWLKINSGWRQLQ